MATESAAEIVCRLPEECVAHAISLTTTATPGDACHSPAVSPVPFRAAAASDAAWARFLPPDHADVLARADERLVAVGCASKEDLFSRLCDCSPVLLDGATTMVPPLRSIDSIRSGAKCFVLSARALSIAWGDDPSCWTWAASPPGSRFPEVAELVDVCWLEISGKLSLSLLSPGTTYAAYLVFAMSDDSYGLECHVGMPPPKATVTVSSGGGTTTTTTTSSGSKTAEHAICLHHMQGEEEEAAHRRKQQYVRLLRRGYGGGRKTAVLTTTREADPDIRCPRRRGDGWAEVEMGEFDVAGDEGDAAVVEVRVQEVDSRRWKRGLVVLGVEIRPKQQTAC